MSSCYRCNKKTLKLKVLNEKSYCKKCYSKVENLLRLTEGFHNLKCPKCGNIMKAGKASVKSSLKSYFVFGFSEQDLWFEPADGSFKKRIHLGSDRSTKAAYCKACDLTLFLNSTKFL